MVLFEKNNFLTGKHSDDDPDVYSLEDSGKPSGNAQKCFLDVNGKGNINVAQKFKDKLNGSFPGLNFDLLTSQVKIK